MKIVLIKLSFIVKYSFLSFIKGLLLFKNFKSYFMCNLYSIKKIREVHFEKFQVFRGDFILAVILV